MPGGYVVPSTGDFGELRRVVKQLQADTRENGRPSGTQTAQALQKLRDLINGILEQVNGIFSGYVQAGGNITSTGGDFVTSAGYLRSPAGVLFDITTPRRNTYWRDSDGRLAWASSSREAKTNIKDADLDPLAILELSARAFNYKAEVAKRDDPDSLEYVGPDYHIATEFGGIAEEFHDLGLWQVVIYEDHWKPIGIHYELVGLLAVRAAQHVWAEHLALRKSHLALQRDVDAIKLLLGL